MNTKGVHVPIEQLNGIELYYESHGDGPVVTFLHGAGGSHISWWQQVPEFSRRYRCITVDQRGFGRSTDPTGTGPAKFADDLEALLNRLGVERTALVAQSMGGRTAMDFTLRYPERVWALAMCDTWGYFDWPEFKARAAALRSPTPGVGGFGARYPREHPRGTFLYQQIVGLNPERAWSAVETSASPKEAVAALAVPTLFVVGSEDPIFPPTLIKAVHELMPGSRYVELDGCGHSGYFEDAPAFNAHVGGFLAEHA